MARKVSWSAWKKRAARTAERLVSCGDLFDATDPYDLLKQAEEAYKQGQTPSNFVQEVFEEDLVRQEYDSQLAAEALEYEEFE